MRVCLCGCGRPRVSLRGSKLFASHDCRARYELARVRVEKVEKDERAELDAQDDGESRWVRPLVGDRPPESAVRERLGLNREDGAAGGVA